MLFQDVTCRHGYGNLSSPDDGVGGGSSRRGCKRMSFTCEIVDRSENAASYNSRSILANHLDLIEPGRIGGREMFGQIIQNDVNLLVWLTAGDYLFEDADEF